LDDLLNNIPAKEEDDEDEEDLHAKSGKIIKFGWMDGVLVSSFEPTYSAVVIFNLFDSVDC
jgi:hypothetical protein